MLSYNQKVRPATNRDAYTIGQTWWEPVTVDTVFTVRVVVFNAHTHHKVNDSGVIVTMDGEAGYNYPFVWDESRFVPVS